MRIKHAFISLASGMKKGRCISGCSIMMALVLCMSACNSDGVNSYDSEAESIPLPELSEDEKLFAGRIPMCFLIDDEAPMSWDSRNDYSTPQMVRDVLTRMIGHKCHIIGPSVAGAPNNYPELVIKRIMDNNDCMNR